MKRLITQVGRVLTVLSLCGLATSLPARNNPAAHFSYAVAEENQEAVSPSDIFADKTFCKLRTGITQKQINKLGDFQLRELATQLLKGTYETKYRVADYECYLSYKTLSEEWNAPGKFYDQQAGVTGINIPAHSKQTVVVDGIPEGMKVELKTVAWFVGKVGQRFDGGDPKILTFPLHNGINSIDYKFDWDGLAYICYYADKNPEKYPDVKVHFVNAQVNGYLSPDKTNNEMHALCAVAPNYCMDVVGKKVHCIWTSQGLEKYCKSTEGDLGYRQFMNVLDSLIVWEHRQLGFEKYNRIPKNRTMAYVNFTYYMFQGDLGVSFHADQEKRVLNCDRLINKDDDAIWGLSHEWGHQHQMQPYFCWAGMSEVSNNLQSYYNIMKMGYRTSGKIKQWASAREYYLEDKGLKEGNTESAQRKQAYESRERYAYSPKMYALCEAMKDNKITPFAKKPARGVAYMEAGIGRALCPLIMLHNYFTDNGFPDFAPDWYEALRQNDDPQGSQIEKKGEVDKYELIASAQNNNKNHKLAVLREKYPESCWIKDNYITDDHCERWENSVPYVMNFVRKASRLVGYNLMPYFEQWGYFRRVALVMNDYGLKYFVLTQAMYDEFKADMDALVKKGEIKKMPKGMVEQISNYAEWFKTKPIIAN